LRTRVSHKCKSKGESLRRKKGPKGYSIPSKKPCGFSGTKKLVAGRRISEYSILREKESAEELPAAEKNARKKGSCVHLALVYKAGRLETQKKRECPRADCLNRRRLEGKGGGGSSECAVSGQQGLRESGESREKERSILPFQGEKGRKGEQKRCIYAMKGRDQKVRTTMIDKTNSQRTQENDGQRGG